MSRNEGATQLLDLLEPEEISREADSADPCGMVRIPPPINRIHSHRRRGTTYAALRALPISIPTINMALTLISMIYPSHYGWNHQVESLTFPITPIHPMPALRSISLTENCCYSQFDDGVIIKKKSEHFVYQNKSYIPALISNDQYNQADYPYGWTAGIDEFCQSQGHHPDCTDPIRRAFIEREFIAHTINNSELFSVLDDYLRIIQYNAAGINLQWLHSAPTPILDNASERATLTDLYGQVALHEGRILHTQKGLRITIPEDKWIGYPSYSPETKRKFSRVAWAQLTQFDKMALMTGLKDGKLDNRTIYLDFDEGAKHDRFAKKELASVRNYFIELAAQTGAYNQYNPSVYQELAYYNDPLELPYQPNWDTRTRPKRVILPYSRLTLEWNTTLDKWDYENQDGSNVGVYSPQSFGRYDPTDSSIPSLVEPIDEFEKEDEQRGFGSAYVKTRGGML